MKVRRTLPAILLVSALAPALYSAQTLAKPETATPIKACRSCNEVNVLLVPDNKSKMNVNVCFSFLEKLTIGRRK